MIPKKAIKEFKEIYFEEVGVLLSQEEATKKATEMLNLFKILSKPLKRKVRPSSGQWD